MSKYSILFFGLLFFSPCLRSQEKVKIFYNSDWKITREDNATYFREAEYDFNTFKLDGRVLDYSISGNLLMEGSYLKGKRNGVFTFYYSNGVVKSRGKYENGRRMGNWEYYYNNGQLKQVILFPGRDPNNFKMFEPFAVLEYYDREGKQLVANGTGTWTNDSIQAGMFDTKSLSTLTGQVKDSLKHGKWELVRVSDGKVMHRERFKKGKLVGAEIFDAKGKHYGTTSSEVLQKIPDENNTKLATTEKFEIDTTVFPKTLILSDVETIFSTVTGKEIKIQNRDAGYISGDYSLLEFIARNLRYPIYAIERRITGKVYVGVVIDSLGHTKDITLVKGVHKDLDNEAKRVVGLVNSWLPAIRNGKTVESTITIPVNFQLAK